MKTFVFSFRNAATALLLLAFACGQNLLAQDAPATIYFEITYLKSQNDDFMAVQDEIVRPFVQERIKQGNQRAWVMFRVLYPDQEDGKYDYVAMNVFGNFNHLHLGRDNIMGIAASVWPGADLAPIVERFDDSAVNVNSQVFTMLADAVPGPPEKGKMPKIVRVNHMKVAETNSYNYAKMEREIFMPMHQASIRAGNMTDWMLLQRILPYGSEWDNDYLTMDMFAEWGDLAAPGLDFTNVHPGMDIDALWEKMATLRELRRGEIWETVSYAMEPAPEAVYKTVKEGTGPTPQMGQEVGYRGSVMSMTGETLVKTSDLGFDLYQTIGGNPYDRFLDKGLMKMKKGGIMTMTVPAELQDPQTKGMTGNQDAVFKIELMSIGDPAPSGAELLEKKIKEHGLDAAKEKYERLQASNPNGYTFREGDMNALGYQLMADGNVDAAVYILQLNTQLYPKSWNACDSLADAYRAQGNKAHARKYYEEALKINPDFTASREKLAKL